jgi:Flp pilus assembly pilin Flp
MREKLDNLYWAWEMNVADRLEGMYCKWKYDFMEKFVKDEEGDSNMVAVIVLIVIVIVVGGVFQDKLKGAVENIFENLTGFIDRSAQ